MVEMLSPDIQRNRLSYIDHAHTPVKCLTSCSTLRPSPNWCLSHTKQVTVIAATLARYRNWLFVVFANFYTNLLLINLFNFYLRKSRLGCEKITVSISVYMNMTSYQLNVNNAISRLQYKFCSKSSMNFYLMHDICDKTDVVFILCDIEICLSQASWWHFSFNIW